MLRKIPSVPMPDRLRERLRKIPTADGEVIVFPVRRAPLPGALRERLLAQAPAPALPNWIRSPRYAVAASYVLALATVLFLDNPVVRGLEAVHSVTRALGATLERTIERTGEESREKLEGLQSGVRQSYGDTRESLEGSLGKLETRVEDISDSLLPQ